MSSKKGAASGTTALTQVLLKMVIASGQATPSPPIGPALGQRGIKAIDFCKQFNESTTKLYHPGTLLRVQIKINPIDRTFKFDIKPPITSHLLKRAVSFTPTHLPAPSTSSSTPAATSPAATLEKCSTKEWVAEISPQQLFEIAKIKHTDPCLKDLSLQSVFNMVVAAAKHGGFKIIRPSLSIPPTTTTR